MKDDCCQNLDELLCLSHQVDDPCLRNVLQLHKQLQPVYRLLKLLQRSLNLADRVRIRLRASSLRVLRSR